MLKDQIVNVLTVKKPRYISKEFLTNLNLYELLMSETSFLPVDSTIAERIYNIVNDIKESVKCQNCKKEIRTWHKFEMPVEEYLHSFCSTSCCKSFEPDMTTFNFEEFSNIKNIVESSSISLLKNNHKMVNMIKSCLNSKNVDFTKMTFSEAYYFVKNDLEKVPKCICGKDLEYLGKGEYRKNCSYKIFLASYLGNKYSS